MGEDDSTDTSSMVHLMAGALAGIAEHCAMYPLDSIKTRMQVLGSGRAYNSLAHALRLNFGYGFGQLWKGVGSVMLGAGPAHALYFYVYEKSKRLLSTTVHPAIEIGVSGACASMASDVLMNPFDVIKQRMQIHPHRYNSILNCLTAVHRKEGIMAFYVSYPTTVLLNVPFHMCHFLTYELCIDMLNPTRKYSPVSHIVAGGCAGAVASSLTIPLDVVKTLLQTQGMANNHQIQKVGGLLDGFRLIYSAHGLAGFLRGFGPRVITHIPATAICWTTYESFKYFSSGSGH